MATIRDIYGDKAYSSKGTTRPTTAQTGIDTNYFLKSGEAVSDYNKRIDTYRASPSYVPPQTAEGVMNLPELKLPNTTPSMGDISSALAGLESYKAIQDIQAKEMERIQAEQQKALDRQAEYESGQKGLISSFFGKGGTRDQAKQQAAEDIGFESKELFKQRQQTIARMQSLSDQFISTQQAMEERIAAENALPASKNYISNAEAQVRRNYAPTLNALSAQINAESAIAAQQEGLWEDAQKYINQAVLDATAEFQFKWDYMSDMQERNDALISSLDKDRQDAFYSALQTAKEELDYKRAEQQQMAEWTMKYGVNVMGKTYEEAAQILQGLGGGGGGAKDDRMLDTKEIQEWRDFTGVPVPFGLSEALVAGVLAGWTNADRTRYEKNTDGFADAINAQLGITPMSSSSGGWKQSVGSFFGGILGTAATPFFRERQAPQSSSEYMNELYPGLMDGYEPLTLSSISSFLGEK